MRGVEAAVLESIARHAGQRTGASSYTADPTSRCMMKRCHRVESFYRLAAASTNLNCSRDTEFRNLGLSPRASQLTIHVLLFIIENSSDIGTQ